MMEAYEKNNSPPLCGGGVGMNSDRYRDIIKTRVQIKVGWIDRIRILISGGFFLEIDTRCENLPGRVESESRFLAENLFPVQHTGSIQYQPGDERREDE